LEDKRGKNDKMFKRVWKAVKTKAEEARVAEAKRGRKKERGGKETRREGAEKRKRKKKKKPKKERTMEVKKMAEEWEIWDEEKEAAKLEEEAKKYVPLRFHEWIYIFEKKASGRMPMRKL